MQSLQEQIQMDPLRFGQAISYRKNASVQPAQTIEPTKEQIQSDSEGLSVLWIQCRTKDNCWDQK